MVARTRHEPDALVLTFERDGAVIERTRATDGKQAVLRGIGLLLAQGELRTGDVLRVTADAPGDDE